MPINYKKYPQTWKEIRQRILERAENKCECCGLENHTIALSVKERSKPVKWYPDAGARTVFMINHVGFKKNVMVVLTIAHLDHDEENHEVQDDRLKAMCQLCHLRYDAAEKKRRKLLAKNNQNEQNL